MFVELLQTLALAGRGVFVQNRPQVLDGVQVGTLRRPIHYWQSSVSDVSLDRIGSVFGVIVLLKYVMSIAKQVSHAGSHVMNEDLLVHFGVHDAIYAVQMSHTTRSEATPHHYLLIVLDGAGHGLWVVLFTLQIIAASSAVIAEREWRLVCHKTRRHRLRWCQERLNWTKEQWHRVLWTDESKAEIPQP